ncbi:uncharacterized protein [Aristolochia californica]|uniref:uncharacterized protein n=1 Tax=Aristolochia californica TaxID=171875 RepID=UPI0035D8E0A7
MAESSEETSPARSPPPSDDDGPLSEKSSQASYPLQLRCKSLNLTNCHACGQDSAPLSLQALDSLWRLVLLCPNCLLAVHSSKVCSYCFDKISSDGGCVVDTVSCLSCARLVHRHCVAASHLESFNCVDCWLPRNVSNKISPRFRLLVLGSSCGSLEDVVKDAELSAKKAALAAEKAKNKALRKAFVAKCAAEAAQGALDIAKVVSSGEKTANGSNCRPPMVHDKELALRLHRAINSSPRIFKRSRMASPEPLEGSEGSESSEDSNCKDDELGVLGPPSCSSKVSKSSEDDNSLDSASASNLKIMDSETKISSDCRGSHSVPGDDDDSSSVRKEEVQEDERFLKKYSRRKNSSVKAVVDGDSMSHRVYVRKCFRNPMTDEVISESADSAPNLSPLQQTHAKPSRTFSGSSFHSGPIPIPAPACSNGHSGQQF